MANIAIETPFPATQLTIRSAFEHARREADRLESMLEASDTPAFDKACLHARAAFEVGTRAVFAADENRKRNSSAICDDFLGYLGQCSGLDVGLQGGFEGLERVVAAEQTKRRAFLMELDPLYCDVIVERWEKFTNREAVSTE